MAKAFNPISPEWNLSSHPLSLSLSYLPPLAHPPLSLFYSCSSSNFLSLALPSLSPARALLTQGSEEDGQTTSQGFLKPATSA